MMRAAIAHILPDRLGDEWNADEMEPLWLSSVQHASGGVLPEAELKGRRGSRTTSATQFLVLVSLADSPRVSATTAPRFPIGSGSPVVVSIAV
jgi:hypothetical protein